MINRFSVPPLFKSTKKLARIASGNSEPDLILFNARVLSTYTDRILEHKEIWVSSGRIVCVKDSGVHKQIFNKSYLNTYDVQNNILAPGLIDPHMHIESSMMTGCAYAEPALLNGTTTIFCDSHEIGNVSDVEGIEWMLEDCRQAPLSIFLTLPSTIPATNDTLETAGGSLDSIKASNLYDKWPEIIGLGEKMDFVSVCNAEDLPHSIIAETLKRNLPVSGHVFGREFVAAYAASGITDTHEAEEKLFTNDLLDAGLWIFLRGGNPKTPWNSIKEAIKAVTEFKASTKRICVCTDDRDADDLFNFGLDWVVRQARDLGINKETAWSMGSLHPATRYNIDRDYGALGHSRRADIIMIDDELNVHNTWLGGKLVVEDKKITADLDKQLTSNRFRYPSKAYNTVHLPSNIQMIPQVPDKNDYTINVIRAQLPGIVTFKDQIQVKDTHSDWSEILESNNLCHLCVIERHNKEGDYAHGFLKNFNLASGAVASSVGHDAHNIIVAGLNEEDMQFAVNRIKETQGGIVIVNDQKLIAEVKLPIAGLLSDKKASEVAKENEIFKKSWIDAGCSLPYMGFNLLPLSVIPNFRITNKGLIDVNSMHIEPLFE
ncbi:MAG: amidohydrolase family protein [Proteobacteria bacterium]|jgi:adenine deaminase|nr:amidohydrolase family protein [Pseudomonadota bacterium]MDA1083865.1 amidohydrolase family protein [Pseudomonadota bacterium]|tara:strand:- start:972 stop:2780 length:1809 start_codon:yes stop_codon:yes gene_type:complete